MSKVSTIHVLLLNSYVCVSKVRGYIGLTFWLSTNHSCFISMDAVAGDKLPSLAFQQKIFIPTATQTLIMEDRTWAKVGMPQGCTNLPAWTAVAQL